MSQPSDSDKAMMGSGLIQTGLRLLGGEKGAEAADILSALTAAFHTAELGYAGVVDRERVLGDLKKLEGLAVNDGTADARARAKFDLSGDEG